MKIPKKPETDLEALALAFFLALTAPSEEKSEKVIALATGLAQGMSAVEIAFAKERAEAMFEEDAS